MTVSTNFNPSRHNAVDGAGMLSSHSYMEVLQTPFDNLTPRQNENFWPKYINTKPLPYSEPEFAILSIFILLTLLPPTNPPPEMPRPKRGKGIKSKTKNQTNDHEWSDAAGRCWQFFADGMRYPSEAKRETIPYLDECDRELTTSYIYMDARPIRTPDLEILCSKYWCR
jgi:hypothetical protein